MRIGIMLRALDESGGISVYARNITDELIKFNSPHEFVLYYRSTAHFQYGDRRNVRERVVKAGNKALWDQVAMPLAAKRDALDVLFHPKFTAPLLAHCPVVMTVHGADWFMADQAHYYQPLDVAYIRLMMPLYIKKCATVISVSQLTTDNFNHALSLPDNKVQTVYFAPARHFRRIEDDNINMAVRNRYSLPERFILTLTKRDGDERKNLGQIFKAYAAYHASVVEPAKLVVGGKDCHLFRDDYGLPSHGYGRDIFFPGWLDQHDLAAIYSLAELYLYPSNLEAFPIPITEAMACGTPIVTADANGLREIAGDAALLVDPKDANAIAEAIVRVLTDRQLSQTLSSRGLQRAQRFSWDVCAKQTLEILEESARR